MVRIFYLSFYKKDVMAEFAELDACFDHGVSSNHLSIFKSRRELQFAGGARFALPWCQHFTGAY